MYDVSFDVESGELTDSNGAALPDRHLPHGVVYKRHELAGCVGSFGVGVAVEGDVEPVAADVLGPGRCGAVGGGFVVFLDGVGFAGVNGRCGRGWPGRRARRLRAQTVW